MKRLAGLLFLLGAAYMVTACDLEGSGPIPSLEYQEMQRLRNEKELHELREWKKDQESKKEVER